MSKEAYYFSHDSNAHNDPKILNLLQSEGWAGYGLYWAIIEMLRNESDFKMRTQYDTYAFALRTEEKRIKNVIENFDLFVVENGFFYSLSLIRRMAMREDKSKKARESALHRWGKKDVDANALRTECERNAIKEKKGKERKGKEREIFNPFSLCPEWVNPDDWKDLVNHRKNHPKKPVESERAYQAIINQLKIAADNGITAKECIDKTIMSSWQSFDASWLTSYQGNKPTHDQSYGTGKRML